MNPLLKAHLKEFKPLTMFIDIEEEEAANIVVIMNYPTDTISPANLLNFKLICLSLADDQVEVVPVFMRVTPSHEVTIFVPQFDI